MERLLVLSLALLIAVMSSACSAQNPAVAPAQPDSGQATANQNPQAAAPQTSVPPVGEPEKEINIVVTPPSGWNPVASSVLPAQYQKNTASFMVKEEGFRGATLDEVADQAKEAFESAFDEVAFQGDGKKITVDGKEALKLLLTCKVSGMEMKYEYVYLFAGGKVWAITFADLTESFDTQAADYEQILSDIRFE